MPDILCFYSKSRDAPPGRGAQEHLDGHTTYADLAAIKDWRKVLSNFHVAPFMYNGATYNTIEHAFQAAKISLADPEKARWFTLESGHEIGQGPGEVARANRKLVKLNAAQIAVWDAKSYTTMGLIAKEKYGVSQLAKQILKATGSAQLWHIMPRSLPVRFLHLERIREQL